MIIISAEGEQEVKRAFFIINNISTHIRILPLQRKKLINSAMDQSIGWFQEEQEGQAKQTWSNIWETELDYQQNLQQQQAANGNAETKTNDSSATTITTTTTSNSGSNVNNLNGNTTFNPTRRKATNDNKASTYNMNKYSMRLVGKHGGCPWRPPNYPYPRGINGWVSGWRVVRRQKNKFCLAWNVIRLRRCGGEREVCQNRRKMFCINT